MLRKSFVCLGMWIILVSAVVAPQFLYAQCVTPPSGIVAWWPLDETAGPTANDIKGYANDGTWMNNPTPVAGKVAGALSFSGSNSVDVPNQAELNFYTGDFSIDLWIKTTNASGVRTILDKRTGSVPNITGYVLFLVNGYLGSQIGDGAGYNNNVSTTGFVANGSWHHVAVTVDRNNPSGWLQYVDGSAVGTPANPLAYQGSLTNTAPFVMARDLITPSHTFAGTLDEVELFNRALDSLEIRSIWAADSLGKCKDTCHTIGDIDGNGIPLQVADLQYLTAFVNFAGPPPTPLYQGDLNGDCVVDQTDIELFQCYFVSGMSCFPVYPIPTCCNPDTLRGACCDSSASCYIRSFANCKKAGGRSLLHGTVCAPNVCPLVSCVHPPTGLVAWYPFDEHAGTQDIAGQHNGYILGNPGISPGKVGDALSFGWASTNQGVVRVKDDPFVEIGEDDFTIDAWVYPEAPPTNCARPWICGRMPIVDNRNKDTW